MSDEIPIPHYNLRSGRRTPFLLQTSLELKKTTAAAIIGAHEGRGMVAVAGTAFQLFADFSTASQGNAYFFVAAAENLAGGTVHIDDVLYTAVVACRLNMAPLAWRHILKHYFAEVVSAPALTSCHAPGIMPRDAPWLAGFSSVVGDRLSKEERTQLVTVIRAAAAILIERCRSATGQDMSPNDRATCAFWELLDHD